MYDDNDKFDFSSYPKPHPNYSRNIIGYTNDSTPNKDSKFLIQRYAGIFYSRI